MCLGRWEGNWPGTNSGAGNDGTQHSLLHLWPFQTKQEGNFILRGVFTTVDVSDSVFPPYLLSVSLVFITDFRTTAVLIGNAFCNCPHSYESNTYKYLYLFFFFKGNFTLQAEKGSLAL